MPRPFRAEGTATALILLAAVLAVWAPAMFGPFQYDDWNVIVEQPAVHSLAAWWAALPGIRPLLKLSYALDWLAGGGSPLAFHLTNLLLHALNTLLVWRLVRRWPGIGPDAAAPLAFWGALVFALHPVQAESVAYVSGRSMSLMACFWLAAFLLWLEADARQSWRWRAAALLAFAAALAVRETALSLPVALLVWHRAAGLSWREAARRLGPMGIAMGFALVSVFALAGYRRLLAFSLDLASPAANLAAQADAYAHLFTRPLFLLETSIDPDPARHAVGSAAWGVRAGAVVAAIGTGFLLLRRRPAWGLALLWPFALLWPGNSLIARIDLVADRHLYLALAGPALLVLLVLRQTAWPRAAPALLVAGLALAALDRGQDFASESALWSATARTSPDKARVWNNLGYGRLVEGDPAGAVEAFRRALSIDPDYARAAVNLERARASMRVVEPSERPSSAALENAPAPAGAVRAQESASRR